ncbi:MAG: hypothetical protein Rhims3KO_20610 [Hyphomicrobiales bacterium]
MRLSVPKPVPYLTLSLALALAGIATAPAWMIRPAHAACSPATGALTPANSSVTCIGTTTNQNGTNGFGTGAEDDVSVTVDEGASVTGDDNGIFLGQNLTLTNNGTIRGTASEGVYAAGPVEIFLNNYRIEAGEVGVWINSGGIASLSNHGTILSGMTQPNGHGIFINGIVQELSNTGQINAGLTTSGAAGIYIANGALERFRNDGTIQAGNDGVLTTSADIENLINTGLIDAGRHGVYAFQGDIVSLYNSGTVRSVGHGIRTFDGEIERVINAGVIQGGDHGVYSQNNGIEFLTNTGTISGQTNSAVRAALLLDRLENSGLIDGATNGVSGNGGIGWLSNTGHITGSGGAAVTTSTGSIGTVINSGTMFGTVDGVYAEIDIGTLTNSGSIRSDFIGVRAFNGAIGSLTNSGTIQGTSFAIQEQGAGDTSLTLNAGSILIGRVDLGGGVNTLNIGEGLSLNSTFESDGGATLVGLGTTVGQLVALVPVTGNGNNDIQVVVVDPSAFASMDDALATLTSGFGGAVQSRQSALRSGPASGLSAGDEAGAQQFDPNRFWIEGFGAYRQQQSERTGSDFDHLTGGLVAGGDVLLDAITNVGVMAGFAASTSENEINTQETNATSYFAGLYASTQAMGLAWDASLTVGYTGYEAERITANNLVQNGLETARADFSGWFINPQVTMTREAANPLAGLTFHGFSASPALEQSLTLSYAGLFLDGYTETGTTNPLTLDDRSVHIASARAALALPFEAVHADGAITTLRLIGGVEARGQFGEDTISGTLLGQAVSTSLDDNAFTGGAFLGLSGQYETTSGLTAYANLEAMLETDMSYQLSATAGLRTAF